MRVFVLAEINVGCFRRHVRVERALHPLGLASSLRLIVVAQPPGNEHDSPE